MAPSLHCPPCPQDDFSKWQITLFLKLFSGFSQLSWHGHTNASFLTAIPHPHISHFSEFTIHFFFFFLRQHTFILFISGGQESKGSPKGLKAWCQQGRFLLEAQGRIHSLPAAACRGCQHSLAWGHSTSASAFVIVVHFLMSPSASAKTPAGSLFYCPGPSCAFPVPCSFPVAHLSFCVIGDLSVCIPHVTFAPRGLRLFAAVFLALSTALGA